MCVCVGECGGEFTSVWSGYRYSHQSEKPGCCQHPADRYRFVFIVIRPIWSSSGSGSRAAAVALLSGNISLGDIQSD